MNNKIVLASLIGVILVVVLVLFYTSRKNTVSPLPVSNSNTPITSTEPVGKRTILPTLPLQTPQEAVVTLKASGFSPKIITVKKDTIVKWVNQSGDVASVYSNNHPTHLSYPPLNLGQFTNGSSLQYLFTGTGTYVYHDHLNPNRTGEVIVK